MVDARDLAEAIATESSIATALNRYDAKQRWRNGYYSLLSAVLTPSFQGQSTLLGMARDLMLPKFQGVPPLRHIMLRTLKGAFEICQIASRGLGGRQFHDHFRLRGHARGLIPSSAATL